MSANPMRTQAKLIVSLSPGIHLRKLQKLLGASFTTTRYHIDNLVKDGEIVRAKEGRYDRLYPVGTAESMRPVYAALQSRTTRMLLSALLVSKSQGLSSTDLSERLSLPRSTLSSYFANLTDLRLLTRSWTPDGQQLYSVRDKEEVARLIAVFERNLLSVATDSFIDLWDL